MKTIELKTCNHLGDTLCLTAAMASAKSVLPDVRFTYRGNYGPVFENTEWQANTDWPPDERHTVKYRDNGVTDRWAQTGTLIEGMTAALAFHLGIDIPAVCKVPQVRLTEQEMEWAERHHAAGAVILNTNCQENSTVKAYPWWNGLIRQLGRPVALIGGTESRDIHENIDTENPLVHDLRGRTSIRQLMALVARSRLVISPSSAVTHIAAAFGIPCITLTGAREPVELTKYPNSRHIHSVCVGKETYTLHFGCMHFKTQDSRSCENTVAISGRRYAYCMACIPPEAIRKTAEAMEA